MKKAKGKRQKVKGLGFMSKLTAPNGGRDAGDTI
jgi:hypothetical protein